MQGSRGAEEHGSKKDNLCRIISNSELTSDYHRLVLEKPFDSFIPGQFCMIRIPDSKEALLRRPFSLCQEDEGCFEIVYKIVGPVTKALSQLLCGQAIWVLGPLGNGLDFSKANRVVGIAGGYGIAPMLGLGRRLKSQDIPYEVYYGARSKKDLLLLCDFKEMNVDLHISTEDGSQGFKGLITELAERDLSHTINKKTLLFVCGPHGLLQAASRLASNLGCSCVVSMERYMACGMGVCLGCVVKMKDGQYIRSCVEGPVMNASSVKW